MADLSFRGNDMRVATYYRNSDVRLEERPMPRIGPGELLLRTQEGTRALIQADEVRILG